jgi:hypothetical protein
MKKIEICKILEECFEMPIGSINEKMVSSDISDWDSLGHFALLEFIESKYPGIIEKYPQLAQASSVEELYEEGLKNI